MSQPFALWEKTMNCNVGIWLDHRKAYIVILDTTGEHLVLIDSNAQPHYRLSGGSRSGTAYGPQEKSSEQKSDEKQKHQLHSYFKRIIDKIPGAPQIWIMGPGEAKTELKKEIEKISALAGRISGIEAADKMTQKQIIARVKDYYKTA